MRVYVVRLSWRVRPCCICRATAIVTTPGKVNYINKNRNQQSTIDNDIQQRRGDPFISLFDHISGVLHMTCKQTLPRFSVSLTV